MEFTQDELFETIDRMIRQTLHRAQVVEPPIDLLHLAEVQFGFQIQYAEPEEPKQYGDRPKRRPSPNTIVLREDQSATTHHVVAARAIANHLTPLILTKLGVPPDTGGKSALNQLMGLIVPRLMLPTSMFATDGRRAGFDVLELQERYSTVPIELIVWRILDVDEEPCVMAIIDDGAVAARKSNRFPVNKQLTSAERACLAAVQETEEPVRKRLDDWTAWGWPTEGIPFRRIILRAVPDEL